MSYAATSDRGGQISRERVMGDSKDKTVRIWDVATGRELLTLRGHSDAAVGGAMELVWRDNDRQLVAAYSEQTTFWDVTAGRIIRTLENVRAVAWSPDRERFADCWGIVETSSGTQRLKLRDSWGSATRLAWSPDGRWLLEHHGGPMFRIRDVATGDDALSLQGGGGAFCWSPDGKRLASVAGDGVVKLWDVESGQELLTLPGGALSVAFSPDGCRLAAGLGNTVTIWDAKPR
ncbi:MAG: PD40 domain-containing protein [Planctomycetia bacterium]|nr:PD40 domain-containing protein [Planctomycetia bacterium]